MTRSMRVYKNITTIRAEASTVEIVARSSRWKPWADFMPWVGVDRVADRGDQPHSVQIQAKSLIIKNAVVTLYVPYSRRTAFIAHDGALLTGECSAGQILCDESSRVDLAVPFGMRRSLGPAPALALALFEDLLYMTVGFVILAALGAAILKPFGAEPAKYVAVYAVVSAGAYVGIRGSAKRALLASMAVALTFTFGPEARTLIREGLAPAFSALGLDDVIMTALWAATFSIGAALRRHYAARTT